MTTNRQSILITGGAGLFAERAGEFLEARYDLVLADVQDREGVTVLPLDIIDYDAVLAAMEGIDAVVHLAILSARHTNHLSEIEYADESMRVNIMGTQHVLEAAAQSNVKRVVLATSQMAMVGWPRRVDRPVDAPYRPADLYGITKLCDELLGELYARTRQLPVACLRFGEPWPRGSNRDMKKLESAQGRENIFHFDEIGPAIECALNARHVTYSVTDILSYSDVSTLDHGRNLIGYRPSWTFTAEGAKQTEDMPSAANPDPLRMAAIVTSFHKSSHADVILSRWLMSRPADAEWGWTGPKTRLAGVYIEQIYDNDIGVEMLKEHGVPVFDSVAEALTLGTGQLAVDGVILIGEHGDYSCNELGQQLYPRKELFDQIVEVFRRSARAAPVFCDKHLSWNFEWAQEMVETAWQLRFPLFSGSSIPLCPLDPPLDIPSDRRVKEAVVLFFGPDEAYGYHSLEFFQAILEPLLRRVVGIAGVTAWTGDDVWEQMDAGTWSEELFAAALDALEHQGGQVEPGDVRENCANNKKDLSAFVMHYWRRTQVTHINLTGHIRNWAVALRLDNDDIVATAPVLSQDPEEWYPHFAALARVIDDTITTGRPHSPLQRALFTTGATAAWMRALATPGVRTPTPELIIPYGPVPCYR